MKNFNTIQILKFKIFQPKKMILLLWILVLLNKLITTPFKKNNSKCRDFQDLIEFSKSIRIIKVRHHRNL